MDKSVRILALTLTALANASAHDLYIMPEHFVLAGPGPLTVALHNGDAFPESEAGAPLARLRDGILRSAQGTIPIDTWTADGKRTIAKVAVTHSGNLLIGVHTVPNFIEMKSGAAASYLREEGLNNALEWRDKHGETTKPSREQYTKYSKALLLSGAPNEIYKQPLGYLIEIVPEKNPYTLKPGDNLPVQVLYRGKPAPDLQLEAAWAGASGKTVQPVGRTDANGRISVPLKAAGKYRLHTIKMERCRNPQIADWESFWASLTFELR